MAAVVLISATDENADERDFFFGGLIAPQKSGLVFLPQRGRPTYSMVRLGFRIYT